MRAIPVIQVFDSRFGEVYADAVTFSDTEACQPPDSSESPATFIVDTFFSIFRDALANRYLPNFKDDFHKEIDYFRLLHTLLRPDQFPVLYCICNFHKCTLFIPQSDLLFKNVNFNNL